MAGCSSAVMLFFVGVIILIGKLGRAGTIDGKQNERDIDVCGTGDAICLYRWNALVSTSHIHSTTLLLKFKLSVFYGIIMWIHSSRPA